MGALSLLLGERASSGVVRKGADRATVEAVFDVSDRPDIEAELEESGFRLEDGLMILRREVAAEGRNRAWVNGSPASAGVVGSLGSTLVDLHGQHEHQTLLRPRDQRALLDAYAGAQDSADKVATLYGTRQALKRELEDLEERVREIETRSDFLHFQLAEIDEAALRPGEDAELAGEAGRHEHAEELARGAGSIYETLYGADDSVADRMAAMLKLLEQLVSYDPSLQDQLSELQDAAHAVSDVGRHVGDYAQGVDHDPRRLAEVRTRLDVIFRLKRKYGPELADVLAAAQGVRTELAELGDSDHDLELLRQRIEVTGRELEEEAARLSALRLKGSARLAAAVCETLPELGLVSAIFEVALRAHGATGSGSESVEFLVSTNVGFDAMPLARIASGGELSRVMLALKAILADVDRVPVLVFDEIDAGVGGVVASAVARKLADVAERHQVFVVTHLAQVASRARAHILVEKAQDLLGTTAAVTLLAGEARVQEIARMLGGDPESPTSREHARELLGA